MKKIIIFSIALIGVVLLSSCNNNDDFEEKSQYQRIIETSSKPGLDVSDAYSDTTEENYGDLH